MALIRILPLFAGLALAAHQAVVWFATPEAQSGPVQKIFYTHLPLAWWALLSFFAVFVASLGYLFTRGRKWDQFAGAAAEIGVLFGGLALCSGSVWARAEWGHWWLWDPKLTTTLIMWYVYAGYLVLRATPMGAERKGLVAAVLGVVAFLDVPLVFFATTLWGGVHPADTARKSSGMTPDMWNTMFIGLGAFGLLWLSLALLRYRQRNLAERFDAALTRHQDEEA